MRVVTGTELPQNAGALDVYLNSDKVATGMFSKGANVYAACGLSTFAVLEVENPTTNGWAGAIECSSDGGASYSACSCATCGSGTGSAQFAVDGNTDAANQGVLTCLSGARCQVAPPSGPPAFLRRVPFLDLISRPLQNLLKGIPWNQK